MSGAILPLPQHALMAWCSVKAQGQLLKVKVKGKFVPLHNQVHAMKVKPLLN
jgi:hypothetical protein